MVIDDYERLQAQQGGVPTTPMQLHANMPDHMTNGDIETPKQISEASSSAEPKQINICGCMCRDCPECGQQYLARHSIDED